MLMRSARFSSGSAMAKSDVVCMNMGLAGGRGKTGDMSESLACAVCVVAIGGPLQLEVDG